MLPCPWCGTASEAHHVTAAYVEYVDDEFAIVCHGCGAMGPEGNDETEAVELWDALRDNTTGRGERTISVVENPSQLAMDGVQLELTYGTDLVVVVAYVHKDFVATMRGALLLIGGMAKAAEEKPR